MPACFLEGECTYLVRVRSSVTVVSNEICCSEIEFVDFYAGYVTHSKSRKPNYHCLRLLTLISHGC